MDDAATSSEKSGQSELNTEVLAPVDGKLEPISAVSNEEFNNMTSKGFAIKPTGNEIYAPFDGTIKFTFSTNHVFGIISDSGLETIIHVGIGTVNMRGKGLLPIMLMAKRFMQETFC